MSDTQGSTESFRTYGISGFIGQTHGEKFPTGVTAGAYTNTNLTVNAAGQITAAANGSTVPGGAAGGSLAGTYPNPSFAATAVTPGSYTLTALTVNAAGQLTAASNGALAATGVGAGAYTNANITVNAAGQITAAANGSTSDAHIKYPSGSFAASTPTTLVNWSLLPNGWNQWNASVSWYSGTRGGTTEWSGSTLIIAGVISTSSTSNIKTFGDAATAGPSVVEVAAGTLSFTMQENSGVNIDFAVKFWYSNSAGLTF